MIHNFTHSASIEQLTTMNETLLATENWSLSNKHEKIHLRLHGDNIEHKGLLLNQPLSIKRIEKYLKCTTSYHPHLQSLL